jgi:hypothetical protein
MYLLELDPFTGLVKTTGPFDGVMSIKEFREVINDINLGVKCMTAIALTVDYLTPIKYYREEDRPYKAMENTCEGDRRAFDWNQDLIQKALIKYDELQYNATVEEKKALDFMLLEKLKEIKEEKDEENRLALFRQLNTIKSLIENFNKANEDTDIYADGPVVNGYKLTRLEEKYLDKNSFYHKNN